MTYELHANRRAFDYSSLLQGGLAGSRAKNVVKAMVGYIHVEGGEFGISRTCNDDDWSELHIKEICYYVYEILPI